MELLSRFEEESARADAASLTTYPGDETSEESDLTRRLASINLGKRISGNFNDFA